ncbi:transcriptional regulator [Cytophagales bacterium WSM2-2]|nr:transcriptional regulator [Cytophagales bacterium WSM2-2]
MKKLKNQLNIGILIYKNCTSSMVTGFWDTLTLANHLSGREVFQLELIAENKKPIKSFSGLSFTPRKTIMAKTSYDLVYIPGFLGDTDEVLTMEKKSIEWLRRVSASGKTIMTAACNGNFLLASSGALRNKKATTHWSLIQKFRSHFDDIDLQPEKILVDNGTSISAAGVTAYFNLALHIIQRFADAELSLSCAKVFLVDAGRKIQTPYQVYQFSKAHGDDFVLKAQDWMEQNFREKITADQLAELVQLGKKTFFRRFKKATGENPLNYLQKLRMETAKRLLESKDITFNEVTWKVGYTDASSFHKAFKQETGLTPIDYRNKFSFA